MTVKNARTIMFASLIAAVIIPILTANAINEVDIEIQAKEKIDEMIKTLQDQLDKTDGDSDLAKKIAGLEDFKDAIILSEQIQQASIDDKPELERQLEEKLEELKEHAGDRYIEATLTPTGETSEELSTESFWLPVAYATHGLSDFEFTKGYDSCWGWDYNMRVGGFVDTSEHIVDLFWNNPNSMYVGSWPCDFTEYDTGSLTYYGVELDGTYYCSAVMPNFGTGASVYPCPFASSGDLVIMHSTVQYEGNEQNPSIRLNPYVKIMTLD